MSYVPGKLVVANAELNTAVENALSLRNDPDTRPRIQRNSMMEPLDQEEALYDGNFHLVDMSYQREDGSFYQDVEICGRNVNWEKVANHNFNNLADSSYYYVNGEKKEYGIYSINTNTKGIENDVKFYVYFYYYSDNNVKYLIPVLHRNIDISIEEADEYIKTFNTAITEEPSNILLLGSIQFNSDGTTEVKQIFRDEGIPAIYAKGSSSYSGPFMVKWLFTNMLSISCPPEYMGGNEGYCGSICAPDMQIIRHLESNNISFTPGQENTLLTLTVIWGESGVDSHWFSFVPDPWKSCTNETKLSAVDFLNPKTEDYPHRNPYMAIYPIARMEGNKIVQIQQGHIVDSNRWWRI